MKYLIILPVLFALCTCQQKQDTKYPYTLVDFPGNLRPHLNALLNEGVLSDKNGHERFIIDSLIIDADLMKLINSEHPIFRSLGLNIIKGRKHLDHFSVLMNHLDDTALVSWYFQCASFPYVKVSDYMIRNYEWKSEQQRAETIDKILRYHNYLDAAYKALPEVSGQAEFYPIIRKMAEREIDLDLRSHALLQLAVFNKQEDKKLIQEVFSKNVYKLNENCFALMENYPDTMYLPILKRYFRHYYSEWCKNNNYDPVVEEKLSAWLSSIASYHSRESIEILEKIFYRKPFLPCYPPDSNRAREILYKVIASDSNPLYKKMSAIASAYLKEEEKRNMHGTIDMSEFPKDTTTPVIRWEYY